MMSPLLIATVVATFAAVALLAGAAAYVVVQRQVAFAAAERGDSPRQLAADVARQRLDVAEDVDPFRGDAVLRFPASSVHRLWLTSA